MVYEGYGPGGAAVFVEALTDNKNRTVSEVRHILAKHGGNLGASGCVAYLFEKRGVLAYDRDAVDGDRLLEAALDAGADDVIESDDFLEVVVAPSGFEALKRDLLEAGFESNRAEVGLEPSTTVELEGGAAESMLRLADALEDLDDVQNVYSNFDISDDEMAKLTG
jgi:YebC/PmpR family DNA-binding regulatory protein